MQFIEIFQRRLLNFFDWNMVIVNISWGFLEVSASEDANCEYFSANCYIVCIGRCQLWSFQRVLLNVLPWKLQNFNISAGIVKVLSLEDANCKYFSTKLKMTALKDASCWYFSCKWENSFLGRYHMLVFQQELLNVSPWEIHIIYWNLFLKVKCKTFNNSYWNIHKLHLPRQEIKQFLLKYWHALFPQQELS